MADSQRRRERELLAIPNTVVAVRWFRACRIVGVRCCLPWMESIGGHLALIGHTGTACTQCYRSEQQLLNQEARDHIVSTFSKQRNRQFRSQPTAGRSTPSRRNISLL